MNNNKKVGLNEQDATHKEGQYSNTSANPAAEENVSMGTSQMNQDRQGNSDNRSKRDEENKKAPNEDRK